MALSIDYPNRIVNSTASITDGVAFHLALRTFEDDADAVLYPIIHTYKEVDLGSGAVFPAVKFVNGWQLKFPNPGNYTVSGFNLSATIVPVAGVFVDRMQSAAYAVTSVGGGGVTPSDVADAVWTHATANSLSATVTSIDTRVQVAAAILRNKTTTNPATGQMTVYADDSVTPLLTAQLFEDAAQSQPYRGQGAEVRGRLE